MIILNIEHSKPLFLSHCIRTSFLFIDIIYGIESMNLQIKLQLKIFRFSKVISI